MNLENGNEQNKTTIVINPFSPFFEKYTGIEISLTRNLPHSVMGIISLAIVAGISNGLMAWVKATWIGYVSIDVTLIIFGILLIWREKILHYDFEENKESSSEP